jgi:putative PIN family toxin of toxin-antitoxin system
LDPPLSTFFWLIFSSQCSICQFRFDGSTTSISTNILGSGLLSPYGKPAAIIRMIVSKRIRVILDTRVFREYQVVLSRPRFNFPPEDIMALLSFLKAEGSWIIPPPVHIQLPDPSDLPFIELSYHTHAPVITGNSKHFPADIVALTPVEFLEVMNQ